VALALSLLFDQQTSSALQGLWTELRDAGISSDMLDLAYPPHLTLLIMDDERLASSLAPALPELAPLAPTSLRLVDVSTFAGTEVVYLSCDSDPALRDLHRRAAALLPEEGIQPYYRPGNWTPHVTLQTMGNASRAFDLARGRWRAGRTAVPTRLELATFLPVNVGEGIDLPTPK
jgi:2'-5' RNA ligase